jgi:hypothetical protein
MAANDFKCLALPYIETDRAEMLGIVIFHDSTRPEKVPSYDEVGVNRSHPNVGAVQW